MDFPEEEKGHEVNAIEEDRDSNKIFPCVVFIFYIYV